LTLDPRALSIGALGCVASLFGTFSETGQTGDWISRQREQCLSHNWFIFRVFGVFRGLNCCFQQSLSVRIRAARANSSTPCNLSNPCNSFNSFGCGSAALCQSVSIGVHPWLIPLARACDFALTAVFWIRCVDVAGGQTRGLEPRAGSISGCAEPFYGTMTGPWWYHTATSVPRVRNLPFSLLRMLMQASRKPPQCDIRATSRRVASHLIGTPRLPQGSTKAPPRLPRSAIKAWRRTTDYGPRTTWKRRQNGECRMQKVRNRRAQRQDLAFCILHSPEHCRCERGWPLLATCSPRF
jgi:hypothetical protein